VSTTEHTTAPAATLAARSLTKRFGERVALNAVSFELLAGELVAIIGPNGAGKTTLLSILAGVIDASDGTVAGLATDERFGWVPQQPALYSKLSVAENLRLFARLEKLADPDAAVARMLEQTDLADRADDEVGRLSGGNQQRVNIAIGLLSEPAVLLLDEPSSSLDRQLVAVDGEDRCAQVAEDRVDRGVLRVPGQPLFDGRLVVVGVEQPGAALERAVDEHSDRALAERDVLALDPEERRRLRNPDLERRSDGGEYLLEHAAVLDRDRARVNREAAVLDRGGAAADSVARFDHQGPVAVVGEQRRGRQAPGTGADHERVESLRR
jgi:ABC-2 type transport system ATP-binding protein